MDANILSKLFPVSSPVSFVDAFIKNVKPYIDGTTGIYSPPNENMDPTQQSTTSKY